MDVWNWDKLFLLFLFFMPGFISIKVYDLLVPGERRDISKSVLDAVCYSFLNYAALWWAVLMLNQQVLLASQPWGYWLLVTLLLFIAPALWPVAFFQLASGRWLGGAFRHPIPKPFDYVFSTGRHYYIVVTFKDGRRVGGWYGDGSFASAFPTEEQILLRTVWKLDDKTGAFVQAIPGSQGAIISTKDAISIELFDG